VLGSSISPGAERPASMRESCCLQVFIGRTVRRGCSSKPCEPQEGDCGRIRSIVNRAI
jgi:hypothetical protein